MTGGTQRGARHRARSSMGDEPEPAQGSKTNSRTRRDVTRDRSGLPGILDANLKMLLGVSVFAFLVACFFIFRLTNSVQGEALRPRVITPFPSPKIMELPQFQGEHRESLYWGTYRPHVYFGIRARTPQSLVAGLMWLGIKEKRYFAIRHFCQDSDELSTYGWMQHNGRDFGHQLLVDQDMTLSTSFLKSKVGGSGFGGDWAVRIEVEGDESRQENELLKNGHLFFYMVDEDGSSLSLGRENSDISEIHQLLSGSREDVGGWQLHLKSEHNIDIHYAGFRTPYVHNLSDLVHENLAAQAIKLNQLQLSDTYMPSSNVFVFQISGRIPFKADIAFVSGTTMSSNVDERINSLTGVSLTRKLDEKQREFDIKFESSFKLADKLDLESINVGKVAIANMLGGIGYFYGQSKISVPRKSNVRDQDNFLLYWPAELYTAVPSRPFFPRGFLWDEGFHQLLIWRWDVHISLDIIGHWLDLMNVDGWIPREQILGAEALSKVPSEFVMQYPSNANPPTLILVLRDLIAGMKGGKFTVTEINEITTFVERAFIRLEAWYQWFNSTQAGKEFSSYYWHGRDGRTIRELNPKTLSSGLDDYPRASHPSEDERHLDLRCWMLLAADCMDSIVHLLGRESKPGKAYGSTAKLLSDFKILNQVVFPKLTASPVSKKALNSFKRKPFLPPVFLQSFKFSSAIKMHLDHGYGAYFDFGNHTEKVRLSWKEVRRGNHHPSRELVREVLETPDSKLVPHIGYVSLFPFIARIIPPESWILGKQLDIISNRSTLWTDYGLCSLSKTSSLYMKRNTEHDPPYWRGPIWMNMNYLILSALHHYSQENGPYRDRAREIYGELRTNLIRNVVRNYYETGFLWEQYDQRQGKGKGARLFTGWTALLLLIMSEAYNGT